MSQIPQRYFSKDRLSQQGKTQTCLHVRAIQSRASGARHRHRRIYKSSLLKWKHCLQRRVARMGHDHKTDVIFFDLFYEVFPKQK